MKRQCIRRAVCFVVVYIFTSRRAAAERLQCYCCALCKSCTDQVYGFIAAAVVLLIPQTTVTMMMMTVMMAVISNERSISIKRPIESRLVFAVFLLSRVGVGH